MITLPRSPLLAFALVTPCAAAHVLEVGGGGAPTIGAAIALAADGDVILVHAGAYPGFTVAAKSLVIVADAGESVMVFGNVVVHSLTALQSVTLQGLEILGDPGDVALRATLNAGPLWIEDCVVRGGDESFLPDLSGGTALQAVACASLVLRRSSFAGGFGGYWFGGPGGHGALLSDSSAAVFACSIQGGPGGWGGDDWGCSSDDGDAGGGGLRAENCALLLQSTTVEGGQGGVGDYCFGSAGCGDGGGGGTGLKVLGAGETTLVQSTLTGGSGGYTGSLGCSHGSDGLPLLFLGGALVEVPEAPRSLEVSSPLREGETASALASGEPFELLAVYASYAPGLFELPSAYGFGLLELPLLFVGAAVLPASGQLQLQAPVPELGASVQGLSLRLQAVSLAAGGFVLGEPATLVLLDAAL